MMQFHGITPEMMENFSKMMSKNNTTNKNDFDSTNMDMDTLMKIASNLNSSNENDPRNNLLNALKPYMRNNKKDKMDNYMNMLNMAKMANLFNQNNDSKKNANK